MKKVIIFLFTLLYSSIVYSCSQVKIDSNQSTVSEKEIERGINKAQLIPSDGNFTGIGSVNDDSFSQAVRNIEASKKNHNTNRK